MNAARAPGRRRVLLDLLAHLRLHFQLLLAPLFLWGFLLAGGRLVWPADARTLDLLVAFVAFHVFGYGGATAFNSYYDRDEGPVGGLATPPPVHDALLPASLALQAIGAALLMLVGPAVLAAYLTMFVVGVAHSHPAVRLKARPLLGTAVIALTQGAVAFLAGWATARGDLASAREPLGWLGALSATLVTLGFYPLSQLFQIAEDARRGDRTAAVVWGPRACFALAALAFSAGGLACATLAHLRFGPLDSVVVLAGFAGLVALVFDWRRRFAASSTRANFRAAMRLNAAAAAGFGTYILVRLALPA